MKMPEVRRRDVLKREAFRFERVEAIQHLPDARRTVQLEQNRSAWLDAFKTYNSLALADRLRDQQTPDLCAEFIGRPSEISKHLAGFE